MEIVTVAHEIEKRIKLLEECRKKLKERGENKATALAGYDRALSIKMLELKEDYPVSMLEKVSKGAISDKRYEVELAEVMYKSLITAIDAITTEIQAYQSIFRHLDEN